MEKKYLYIIGFSLLIGLVLGMVINWPSRKTKTVTKTVTVVKTDSITVFDTVKIIKPIPKDSLIVRYETVKLPTTVKEKQKEKSEKTKQEKDIVPIVTVLQSDNKDSVEVEIPIEQKIYSDSLYTAYVSGWHPSLDSIQVYPRKDIIHHYINTTTETTKEIVKDRKFHIGIIGGYGYGFQSKNLQPFIGLGISWKLF